MCESLAQMWCSETVGWLHTVSVPSSELQEAWGVPLASTRDVMR